MEVKVLAFGACRDIVKSSEIKVELSEPASVSALRENIVASYPELANLRSMMIAVNNEYSTEDLLITSSDEIALIPPVSGG